LRQAYATGRINQVAISWFSSRSNGNIDIAGLSCGYLATSYPTGAIRKLLQEESQTLKIDILNELDEPAHKQKRAPRSTLSAGEFLYLAES